MNLYVHPPETAVREAVSRALAEDLTPLGDLTSSLLPVELETEAALVPRQIGVLAGRLCADESFRQIDPELDVHWLADDGDRLEPGRAICRVGGSLASILTAERTALNFLGHLSGIASLTAEFVAVAEAAGAGTRVWDTRKTTPGLRSLEKAAVRAGGGVNHRGNLSEWILLKDNHLALLPIADAVAEARRRWPGRAVEVECDDLAMLREGLAAGADVLLVDNMTPAEVREAVAEVRASDRRRPLLEISGGVDRASFSDYAECGADLCSIGALTHSAPVLDIGLDVDPPPTPPGTAPGPQQ